MRAALLPAAQRLYERRIRAWAPRAHKRPDCPLIAVTLAVGLGLGCVLYLASRWLRRRTNRVLNVGLVVAGAAVIVSLAWLAIAYSGGRSDLLAAQARGSTPVAALARVDIAAQQAHADESLTLIDNSGDDIYQQDYLSRGASTRPGTRHAAHRRRRRRPPAARPPRRWTAAVRDAQAWYAAHAAGPRARRQREPRRGRRNRRSAAGRPTRASCSRGCRPTSPRRWPRTRPRSTRRPAPAAECLHRPGSRRRRGRARHGRRLRLGTEPAASRSTGEQADQAS